MTTIQGEYDDASNPNGTTTSNEFITASRIIRKTRAEALIRKLRWAVLFAKHEPKIIVPDIDEDTGQISYGENIPYDGDVREMLRWVLLDEDAQRLFLNNSWSPQMMKADYDALLAVLPPHHLEEIAHGDRILTVVATQ